MSLSPVVDISGPSGSAYYQSGDLWIRWVCPEGRAYSFDTTGNPPWNQPGFDGNFDFQTNIEVYVRVFTPEPQSINDLHWLRDRYLEPCVFTKGVGYSDGAKVAVAVDTGGEYWIHVTARNGGIGFFSFQWAKWDVPRLAKCNSCPPDWDAEVCVADWQLQHLETDFIHSLGSFPAGNYKLRCCTDLTLNGIVAICGPYFEQFRGAFNIWNDDQAYPAAYTLYDWVHELGGFGAYYNTQVGCDDYYWQSDIHWESISGTGPLGSIPPGLVGPNGQGTPSYTPDTVDCLTSPVPTIAIGTGYPTHQSPPYSPCSSYHAGWWVGGYTIAMTTESGVATYDEAHGNYILPSHSGCLIFVVFDAGPGDPPLKVSMSVWDGATYTWSGRRAKTGAPPHRPYCGVMWGRVDHPLPPQPCSQTDIFCHPGGEIGVAYAGAEYRSHDLGRDNPIVRLVDINAGVKHSITSDGSCEMGFATLESRPEKGLSLRLFFQTLLSAAPMTWNWHLEARSGSFGTGNVSSGQVTIVPNATQNIYALLDYGVNVYEDGSVGPTYPLVLDLVFTDPCSGNEVLRLPYTFTPVVTANNLGFLKDTCALNDGYVYIRFQNSGNAFLRNMTVTGMATARQIGWVNIDQNNIVCRAAVTFGPTATITAFNHGQALDLALRIKGTGATRITITAADRGEPIPPFVIDL